MNYMLSFVFTEDAFRVDRPEDVLTAAEEELKAAFRSDRYRALFQLGFYTAEKAESPSLSFLRLLSKRFLKALTSLPDLEVAREHICVELSDEDYEAIICCVPFGIGTEYIGRAWISLQFMKLTQIYAESIQKYEGSVALFLTEHTQDLRVPERVFFHLVENRNEDDEPFAFLATYSTKDSEGKVTHMPLSYALEEYRQDREHLLTLLSCLSKVAEVSPLLASFIESGEMFHPLRMSSQEAYEFLKAVPEIEDCGVVCRVPNWWKQKNSSVDLQVKLGEEQPSMVGFGAIIAMKPELIVDGVPLTDEEIRDLLMRTEGLALLKGRWIEVNHERLNTLLKLMDQYRGEMTLLEALKFEAGLKEKEKIEIDVGPTITNGKWLGSLMKDLRQPQTLRSQEVPQEIRADLRSYQKTGFQWLCYMNRLGFGACLADDMGLGKTLQVLTYLTWLYEQKPDATVLLIAPASLLGNWEKEAERFAPGLPVRILHGGGAKNLEELFLTKRVFLNITTYGMALRMERLADVVLDCLVLDEAQAIKNPGTKQTRAIKKLQAKQRIAMTGTPIENDLSNLWSLFDFLDKGLLGTSKEFQDFSGHLSQNAEGYEKLKNMISPFILRRLKSDKKIIADLPDKVEKTEYISLSQKQIVLYRKLVKELEDTLSEVDGMKRRGIVLAAITKLKQICNHPDQYMGQERYLPKDSGKFEVLRTLCETIYEKRERVLIFTQYKEIIPYLESYLEEIFGCEGLVIHGGVHVKTRQKLVEQFNGEDYVPFMILSLKAGGTGLNLTAANHVIHFDRWWNPAVENQATDRAYRIGQNKSVIVHKFVAKGTIEERIDAMIQNKVDLAESVIGTGENWITEMSDSALLDLMRLEA